MELEQIWEEALKMIEEETSPVSFATWIQPIVPCGIIGNKIILQVKESFLKEIIEKRHLPLIRTAIKMVTKNEYDIMITTEEEQKAGNLHNLAAEKPAENELARNLNLRNTPEIRFILDESIEYGVNMSKLIDEVTKDLHDEDEEGL